MEVKFASVIGMATIVTSSASQGTTQTVIIHATRQMATRHALETGMAVNAQRTACQLTTQLHITNVPLTQEKRFAYLAGREKTATQVNLN